MGKSNIQGIPDNSDRSASVDEVVSMSINAPVLSLPKASKPAALATLLLMTLWLVFAGFPFLWTLWGSFKVEADFFSKVDWRYVLQGTQTLLETGSAFTTGAYHGILVEESFWQPMLRTLVLVVGTVSISLVFGTLGGYALSRSSYRYGFWILLFALACRALPHITLVAGYLNPLFALGLWGDLPIAIIVLVAINQPFTLWLMYAFFRNVSTEFDDSAMLDGCSRIQAFRHVIVPLMWPGVITAGLFSFLLAYNDFVVTSLILDQDSHSAVPAIAAYLGTTFESGRIMYAVAAVMTITAPLLLVVLLFQRRLIAGFAIAPGK